MKKLILTLLTLAWVAATSAYAGEATATKTLVNVDSSGIAIQGYDPVAFFTDNKPVKGDAKFVVHHNGANYLFASKEHNDLFNASPEKYEPAFGGYCAYGCTKKKLVEIDVDAFQIVDGRLLLQYSKGIRDDFNKDAKGNLAKAEGFWPELVEKKGKVKN